MRAIDFAPLYRSTVGFDRLFSTLDSLSQPESAQTYPPYNIERTAENAYRITMAVAGHLIASLATGHPDDHQAVERYRSSAVRFFRKTLRKSA